MMAEAEALNGIFAADDITYAWYAAKGITGMPYPRIAPGADARYEIDERLSLPGVTPMIAKPFSPGNAFPAEEVARERIQFDKAMIGSCTNGSYDDLLQAALVIDNARKAGITKAARELLVFPGSGGVGTQMGRPDPRLGGASIVRRLPCVGGEIRQSCAALLRPGSDALTPPARHHSFNRNWQIHGLAAGLPRQPRIVAASALAATWRRRELGLTCDPELYGI